MSTITGNSKPLETSGRFWFWARRFWIWNPKILVWGETIKERCGWKQAFAAPLFHFHRFSFHAQPLDVFSCPEQLNRTHCLSVCLSIRPQQTIRSSTTLKSDLRELWPLRHLIRGIRIHDLTQNDLPTYLPTHLPVPTYITDHSLSHFWFTVCSSNFSCYR